MKRKIVKVRIVKLNSRDMETEILQNLTALQTEFPELEWDFNVFGIQFTYNVAFRGYSVTD